MDGLVIEYHDPLFGVIVFVALVFVVSLANYGMVTFKRKKERKHVGRFVEQFQIHPSQDELQMLLQNSIIPSKSLLLLAQAYFKNGEYEQSIEIYQVLLSRSPHGTERKELLLLLGQTYFMAGFMQRSKQTLLELLQFAPRTPEALKFLMVIYERLFDFNKAKEVLEPLQELGIDTAIDTHYITLLSLMSDTTLDTQTKCRRLREDFEQNGRFARMIFEYLFSQQPRQSWRYLTPQIAQQIIDTLWNLSKEDIDFAYVEHHPFLVQLYSAKGYLNKAQKAKQFELDLLIRLSHSGYSNATLQFEYLCDHCKQLFPLPFNRCPNCLALDSSKCEINLTPVNHEAGYSFQ